MQSEDGVEKLELISRAQAGDTGAFQQLAELHAETLCRCAFTFCRDRQWAEDIAQETLVEAWRSLSRFNGQSKFSSWLYGIARHRFLKSIRRNSVKTTESLVHAENFQFSDPNPQMMSQQAEDAARLKDAVALLPEEHRQVIELRFFAGASMEEIAAALACPLGTVKSRLHHGLEKLRNLSWVVNHFDLERENMMRLP
jgi:RNA polymerase sigma-70 factor, ECF subfamily